MDKLNHVLELYSLKINELIQSSQAGIFLTQLLLKIPMLELKNHFVLHWTWAVDIQLMLKFLQLIHDFQTNDTTIRMLIYMFPATSLTAGLRWLAHSDAIPLLRLGQRFRISRSPRRCGRWCQAHNSNWMFNNLKLCLTSSW